MEAIATQQNNDTAAKQYIVVRLGNEQYGIGIKYIDNIVRMQKITRVTKSQDYFVGVINLRGEIVPVMSLRKKFGLEDDEVTGATRIIILKPEQQATVGFIVDSVKEVVTLEEDQIEKNNVTSSDPLQSGQSYIGAVGKYGDELISLLNINAVISDGEQA